MSEKTITVGLGERTYPLIIGTNILSTVGKRLAELAIGKRYAIVTDTTVAELYGERLFSSLQEAGLEAELFTFAAGEASKNLQTIALLASEIAGKGFDRQDAIIALGGGVSGDMAGFLAAMYMRGIPFVQIPTTLLAQVDSSVGGKTGVDIPEGKNLLGAFYQPKAVFIDTDVLQTLPVKELRGGLAEVIKYGVIMDEEFFTRLEQEREKIFALDSTVLSAVIARCCELKAEVVEKDEREGGLRRILNFGHTIGHAVEAASGYSLIHGYAVAIGMVAATRLAVMENMASRTDAQRLYELLQDYGLPVEIPTEMETEELAGYLQTDKKTIGGRVFFVLPESVGTVVVTDEVDPNNVEAVLCGSDPLALPEM